MNIFTTDQERFLYNYCPADTMITSSEEAKRIEEALSLNEVEDIQTLRNNVVMFYHDKIEAELEGREGWTETAYNFSQAMMSVTAVIDNIKYKRGLEI